MENGYQSVTTLIFVKQGADANPELKQFPAEA